MNKSITRVYTKYDYYPRVIKYPCMTDIFSKPPKINILDNQLEFKYIEYKISRIVYGLEDVKFVTYKQDKPIKG